MVAVTIDRHILIPKTNFLHFSSFQSEYAIRVRKVGVLIVSSSVDKSEAL
jgi:hypothetical protein